MPTYSILGGSGRRPGGGRGKEEEKEKRVDSRFLLVLYIGSHGNARYVSTVSGIFVYLFIREGQAGNRGAPCLHPNRPINIATLHARGDIMLLLFSAAHTQH